MGSEDSHDWGFREEEGGEVDKLNSSTFPDLNSNRRKRSGIGMSRIEGRQNACRPGGILGGREGKSWEICV